MVSFESASRPEDVGRVALFLDPPTHHYLKDRLFDPGANRYGGDDILAPFVRVRNYFEAVNIPVHTADMIPRRPTDRLNIYVSMGRTEGITEYADRSDIILSAYFAFECPAVEPRIYRSLPRVARKVRRVFSFSEAAHLLPFTRQPVATIPFVWPQCRDGVDETAWARKQRLFLTMINANKLPRLYYSELYTARLAAVAYFEQFGEIDLYGKGWDRPPMRVGRSWVPWTLVFLGEKLWQYKQSLWPDEYYAAARRAWKGVVASKIETLSRYGFAICCENMILPGWVTEKIFDCFAAGCVPIYWGDPTIAESVPPEAFVDMRQFGSLAELRTYLHSLLDSQVENYREAARSFMEGPRYERYRPGAFVELFRRIVSEDTGLTV
jgi:hypothetical protein